MKWTRLIPLACLVVINIVLLVQTQRARGFLRGESAALHKQADELNRLGDEVMHKSDGLKSQTERLKNQTERLKNLIKSPPFAKTAKDGAPTPAGDNHCAMIHKPKAGCPPGYIEEIRPSFTERDGSHQFACLSDDPVKARCIDRIGPGESFEMHIIIPLQPPAPEPASESPKT